MLTLHAAVTSWSPDPFGITVTALLAVWYTAGVLRVRRSGERWSCLRCLSFVAGLLLVAYAICGWFGTQAHAYLWAFTAELVVLLVLAPALLLFGRPITLARRIDAMASAGRRPSWIVRVADSTAVGALSHPALGPVLLPLITGLTLFTGLLGATLAHPAVLAVVQLGLLLAGFVMALGITGEGRSVSSMAMAGVVLCAFLELLADAVPGIALRLRSTLLDPAHFLAVARRGGPTPLNDLHLAGSILWFVAETIDLPVLAILVVAWIRADEREAREVDRRLNLAAPDPSAAPTGALGPGAAVAQGESALQRPWWEVDGAVFGTRREAELRDRR